MIDLFYSSIGEKLTEIIRDAFGVNLLELIINLVATIILCFGQKSSMFADFHNQKMTTWWNWADFSYYTM